ncbi:YcjF family protein [Pseudanabaena sp. FACHB-2040]|uniref:YcjF family protein n=1 Tax=Pseudanabaena sp. FACHB-2040 TaxID=2692859 RepID=UPI001684C35E|nr:YcjF family protein [Pseudanabaena sp. FACHB-2040]MBD2257586.1 YcjF family protein [Pseudanabaena sp. FACHB-2040]
MLAKRPILIGGLGLSATLWLLDTVQFHIFDSSTLLSAIALGSGIWWWRRQSKSPQLGEPKLTVADRPAVERAVAQLLTLRATLATAVETTLSPSAQESWQAVLAAFEQQVADLKTGLERQTLQIGLVGEPRSGKSTLLSHLQTGTLTAELSAVSLNFQEFPLPADSATVPDELTHQDAVFFLTAGDLTDSAYSFLKQRLLSGQRLMLVFNKQDQYLPADRESILQQLRQRVASLPLAATVVAIAAAPRPIKVRRHQEDGQFKEWLEPVSADLTALTPALGQAAADRAALVYATTLRQSETLRREMQTALNQVHREQALPLVEQLQWIAGAAAFASPVPSLDLLAAVAINGQLIMDLGRVYGFQFSLEEAKTAAATLASLTVKLGLVELSTQALTTVLKSHAATYVAGGVVQGLSAAYLTRLAGLSLIEHFEAAALAGQTAPTLSLEGFGQRLQALFQQNSQGALLLRLVQQGLERLRPAPATQPALPAQV